MPLLTLLQPNVSSGIVDSLLSMYEQGGALPRWPIANGIEHSVETASLSVRLNTQCVNTKPGGYGKFLYDVVYGSSMIGNHGYQVILGNILKNPLLRINFTEAYLAMKEEVSRL